MPQNRLRELRLERGLTQAELAREVGVNHSRVSRWERTEGHAIPDRIKAHLAEILQVSVPFLMGWDDANGDNGESEVAA